MPAEGNALRRALFPLTRLVPVMLEEEALAWRYTWREECRAKAVARLRAAVGCIIAASSESEELCLA